MLDNDSQRGKVVRAVAGSQTVPQSLSAVN
ncbi:hybrid peroxiredoxin HyPrx5 [Actinobacillus equuli]|nr:hybrid peroxiredoxin HyPrx5 [Actinobacillus equuli]